MQAGRRITGRYVFPPPAKIRYDKKDMKPGRGPDKHKELGIIQGVIDRPGSNSFSIKQWRAMLVSAPFVLGHGQRAGTLARV